MARVLVRPRARQVRKPEFRNVRMWRVEGFENYLIFYFPQKDGIAVERVIHASRDYRRLLRWLWRDCG